MNNRWKIVEYYIYTRTKQEDFVLKQVEVLIDAPEKAKKLCHILSGHKGAFDLAKGRIYRRWKINHWSLYDGSVKTSDTDHT